MTSALRRLGIMVFKVRRKDMPSALASNSPPLLHLSRQADIHTARIPGKPLQEVHRFLLTDAMGLPIDDPIMRDRVVRMVCD